MGLAYCPKCKDKKVITQAFIRVLTNQRVTEQGQCRDCGTNISRFLTKVERLYFKKLNREGTDGKDL